MSTSTWPCATAWPPLLTNGLPVAGNGVDKEDLGTTMRNDWRQLPRSPSQWMAVVLLVRGRQRDVKAPSVSDERFTFNADGTWNAKVVSYNGNTMTCSSAGRDMYEFDVDTDGTSKCYGQCAVNWPRFLTDVQPGRSRY